MDPYYPRNFHKLVLTRAAAAAARQGKAPYQHQKNNGYGTGNCGLREDPQKEMQTMKNSIELNVIETMKIFIIL